MSELFTPETLVSRLAERSGVSAQQVRAVLQAQAELAYENVATGCPVPGLGIFEMGEAPEKRMTLQFGPRKGETVVSPAKPILIFRIAKVAKEVVLRRTIERPNIFEEEYWPRSYISQE